jgi:hypothetical protein
VNWGLVSVLASCLCDVYISVYVKRRGLVGNIRIPYFVGLVLFRRK